MKEPICIVRSPDTFVDAEIEDFLAYVRSGGEVALDGLPKRVREAHSLAFLRREDCLIGVAGLKFPEMSYRKKVEIGAGMPLPSKSFPLELGWVFVLPSAHGGKSYPLCAPLVEACGGKGIFATSRSGNDRMHSTLRKLGFARAGGEWPSGQNPEKLWLYIKHAV